jgi:glycosyltransferase involved in cell wall biosynthesis
VEAKPRVVAVIPALNEEGAIGGVVAGALPHVDEVIVVDNGSTDATADAARAAGATVVPQPERGYGAACMAGVEAAPDATTYVFLDGDGADPPEILPRVLHEMQASSAGLVLGTRKGRVEAGSILWHQRLGNWFMSRLITVLTRQKLTDLPSFKVIDGQLIRSLGLRERTHGWTAEVITACACRKVRIIEVETGYKRRIGQSKVSGSLKGSALAAYRLNAAIVRVWWQSRSAGAATQGPVTP